MVLFSYENREEKLLRILARKNYSRNILHFFDELSTTVYTIIGIILRIICILMEKVLAAQDGYFYLRLTLVKRIPVKKLFPDSVVSLVP